MRVRRLATQDTLNRPGRPIDNQLHVLGRDVVRGREDNHVAIDAVGDAPARHEDDAQVAQAFCMDLGRDFVGDGEGGLGGFVGDEFDSPY